ncbi:MAG TPA: hypothetical protein VEX68_02285, partial [Bryobacteraceae bacterium]|nr:hypothetical protein [Bryobacteraceae bacterium]
MTTAKEELTAAVLSFSLPEETIHARLQWIYHDILQHSRYIRRASFTAIHPEDLAFCFEAYDRVFFAGLCRRTLNGRKLTFRLSRRMTRVGGTTTRLRSVTGEIRFEIAVAIGTLFDGFSEDDRTVTVGGLDCRNRLEAMQRIFEHELTHLVEQLCWDKSDCTAERFQDIAARYFLHRSHTHNLITRKERAAISGIRPGARVTFEFGGRRLTGVVNRVTKRATVLVEDPNGRRYSDGRRYQTFYVPLADLQL